MSEFDESKIIAQVTINIGRFEAMGIVARESDIPHFTSPKYYTKIRKIDSVAFAPPSTHYKEADELVGRCGKHQFKLFEGSRVQCAEWLEKNPPSSIVLIGGG